MDATQLKCGMVIDYRGYPATVISCWTKIEDAEPGFDAPVGAVIEWTVKGPDGPVTNRCRLVWPEIDPEMRAALKAREEAIRKEAEAAREPIVIDDPVAKRAELFKQSLAEVPVTPWGE